MKNNISVCGTDCSTCYCYGKMCNGCNACEGKVFHVPQGKACSIYECVKENKCIANCGKCSDIPCEKWIKTRDPKFSDEEFEENINNRIKQLRSHS